MGKLYVIATPIGHRNDITLRALEHLRTLDIFFAEDTRELEKLMMLHGVDPGGKRLYSYAKHNLKAATDKALALLKEGRELGLTTDRGTPGISDPGAQLIRAAREQGNQLVVLPGASSPITAFCAAGMTEPRFLFAGFPPDSPKAREALWAQAEAAGVPLILLEAPHRVRATAGELAQRFPTGQLFVAREMTKMHETFSSHPLADFKPEILPELGEYVLTVEPGPAVLDPDKELHAAIATRLASDKEWSKRVGDALGLTHSDVYNALQKKKRESSD